MCLFVDIVMCFLLVLLCVLRCCCWFRLFLFLHVFVWFSRYVYLFEVMVVCTALMFGLFYACFVFFVECVVLVSLCMLCVI